MFLPEMILFCEFQQVGQMFQPGGAGYFVPTMPQAQRSFFNPAQMAQVRHPVNPRWQTPQQLVGPAAQSGARLQGMPVSGPIRATAAARAPGQQQAVRANVNARPITGE